jgi:hypothetical protein
VNTSRRYSLTYDIIHWSWKAGKRETFSNSVIGRVVIQHEATDNQASYKISQRVAIGGVDNFLEAEIVCDRDDWDLLRYWTLRTFHTTATGGFEPLSELAEKGRCSGGQIRIESSSHAYAFSAENPVATQWSILDFLLRKADASSNATFDLLQDLSLFKPNHSMHTPAGASCPPTICSTTGDAHSLSRAASYRGPFRIKRGPLRRWRVETRTA